MYVLTKFQNFKPEYEKAIPTSENMCRLRSSFFLAKEVGEELGRGQIL